MNRKVLTKDVLDQLALNIEFLLISVVEGLALGALATSAIPHINNFNIEYWPYIAAAFLSILIFWSGSILHALSFIDWPLDLVHNFLYFLAVFLQVMSFYQIGYPLSWFGFSSLFFGVGVLLYIQDLKLIVEHYKKESDKNVKALYKHTLDCQLFEAKVYLPAGLIFNLGVFGLIYYYPEMFIGSGYHVYFGLLQFLIYLYFLIDFIRTFKRRSYLLSQCVR